MGQVWLTIHWSIELKGKRKQPLEEFCKKKPSRLQIIKKRLQRWSFLRISEIFKNICFEEILPMTASRQTKIGWEK